MAENEEAMSVRDAGRKGGESTLKRWGVGFFRDIGRRGGRRTAQLYGNILNEFGKRGGRPRRPDLGDNPGEGKSNKSDIGLFPMFLPSMK